MPRIHIAVAFLVVTTLVSTGAAVSFWQQTRTLAATDGSSPTAASPYVAQLASDIRGLSAQEITDLSEGNGMGLARAAELNSYPGPRHVLDARAQLGLTPEQTGQVEAIWQPMNAQARALGLRILQGEQALEQDFRGRTVTDEGLRSALAELEALRTELRYVHLQAHLAALRVLTPEQTAAYNRLRGYVDAGGGNQHRGH